MLTANFAAALKTVDTTGDFFAVGRVETFAPNLHVDGVGPIALPVLPAQAEQLIAQAERAPYGKGAATLTDTAVRRTWQIAPDRIRIAGRRWPATMEAVLERVAAGLGLDAAIEAELYKMLVYDQGSFFVPHRDTEKSPGMFATLILALPSASSGGELIVRHKDREARLDLQCNDPSELAFAAFYADCVHEVLPVTAGHRVVLVYNLLRKGRGKLPQPPDHANEATRLERLLAEWDEDGPTKLVYPLAHAYTQAELDFGSLKGADAGIAKVVAAAAGRTKCSLHLALLTIEESGSAEYSGDDRWGRQDEDEFEAGEVDDRSALLAHWRRPDGTESPLTALPLEDGEVSPLEALERLVPDEEHFQEATGNAGASFERTYRRAALVLWPGNRLFAIINQAGLGVTLPYLTELAGRGDPAAHELAGHMIDTWPHRFWFPDRNDNITDAGRMLDLLVRMEDAALADRFLSSMAGKGGLDKGDTKAVADGLRLLPADRGAALLLAIVRSASGQAASACAVLLAHASALGKPALVPAAAHLVGALPTDETRDAWNRPVSVTPGLVTEVLKALPPIDATIAERAARHFLAEPAMYPPDGILIPALRPLASSPKVFDAPATERIRRACARHLSAHIAETLEPPREWARPAAMQCDCARCKEVSRFLANAGSPRWALKAAAPDRDHVANAIRQSRCDLDMDTDTKGRPYTLICTKNQASYERRVTQRREDIADLALLGVG